MRCAGRGNATSRNCCAISWLKLLLTGASICTSAEKPLPRSFQRATACFNEAKGACKVSACLAIAFGTKKVVTMDRMDFKMPTHSSCRSPITVSPEPSNNSRML
eukprot:8761207-Alexandrium_andersonii.AAC.1